jgi:hypothetical protein
MITYPAVRLPQESDISFLILRRRKEMEGRAIMPKIIKMRRPPGSHIGDNPFCPRRSRPQSMLGGRERLLGNVEDSNGAVAFLQEGINKAGGAAADIDD